MTAQPELPNLTPNVTLPLHVCPGCGLVHTEWVRALRSKDAEIEWLKNELVQKGIRISRLTNEQTFHKDTDEVLDYWCERCFPNAKEAHTLARRKPTSDRLKGGFTKDDLMRCIDGYALKPYVVNGRRTHEGPKERRYIEPSLIFRDPEHVESGLAILERADELRAAFTPEKPSAKPERPALGALGRAALAWVSRKVLIFPCRANEKRPATRNGLNDATMDLDRIAACWGARPDLNIGIRCGAVSGLVVIDIDGDDGWDSLHRLEDEHGELPETASVVTPSGGQHLYFEHPGPEIRNSVGILGAEPGGQSSCLDIRGDGGYVVAPPSVVNGRRYEVDVHARPAPLPAWVLEELLSYEQRRLTALNSGDASRWVTFLRSLPSEGQRNIELTSYCGHLYHSTSWAPEEVLEQMLLVNGRLPSPLAEKDVVTIVRSIGGRHLRQAAV